MKHNRRSFFRNPIAITALLILVAIILFCFIYPLISPFEYWQITGDRLQPPSPEHPLGTDKLGRDFMTRIAFGGRITLSVAFFSGLIAAVVGTAIGILCGYVGGSTDSVVMRLIDALSSVPSLLLAIVLDYMLGMGRGYFLYGIAIAGIPPFARLVRSATLQISGSAYIESSRALGARPLCVIREHVVRNVLPLAAIQVTTSMADALTICTILGYIGVGINPPTPEWGALFDSGKELLRTSSHLAIIPAAAIILCIICLYLLGNGIRDSLSSSGGDV
ncbi:MAG: ABC transporter permease [Oscillospiraceae bacterium]|nr:ABC transporter permease [Oscillospiraceae bacterium]